MALKDILFVGDIHGSMSDFNHAFEEAARNKIDTIIQVGDFWLYEDGELDKMKRVQKRVLDQFGVKVELHFIDGNHEDFRIINPHLEDTVEMVEGVLYYHPRGTVFEVKDVTIGCFGGAVSIDKPWRIPGKTWFDDEIPTMSDTHRALQNFENAGIDILVTHDVPAYAINQVGHHDIKLDCKDSIAIRENIENLSIVSKAPVVIHGHWHHFAHESYEIQINKYGDTINTNVVSLNRESGKGALVTLDDNGNTVNIVRRVDQWAQ